ncbi:MAG: hypothetical protein GY754_28680 [bacterium]|nr:hypothetical protein [bacterium]
MGTVPTVLVNGKEVAVLKTRIIAGTDWFMGEGSKFNQSRNYGRIFLLLKSITLKLDTMFDVWQQFMVINPLSFLGLIELKIGEKPENCKPNKDKLDKFGERCTERLNHFKIQELMKIIPDDIPAILKKFDKTIKDLSGCSIKNSEDIKKDDELLIVT